MRLLCLSLLLKLVSLEPHYQGEMHISKKTVAKGLSAAAKIVALAETGGGLAWKQRTCSCARWFESRGVVHCYSQDCHKKPMTCSAPCC